MGWVDEESLLRQREQRKREQIEADAEVGRLLREAADRWPDLDVSLECFCSRPVAEWCAGAQRISTPGRKGVHACAWGPTPAEALRALLGGE
jgi:hypothetical protein